ncbi:3-ketoacyl-CoA thiolase [Streptomyces violaceorubidus]
MPEAVIVSAARSPIGRAFKGSLKDLRPDDLAATIIQAALAKVPELDPRDIDDLMGGLPGGEQGNNLGRIVAVQMGMDNRSRSRTPTSRPRRTRATPVPGSPPSWPPPAAGTPPTRTSCRTRPRP